MTTEQTVFFNEIKNIQNTCINILLSNTIKYEKVEDMLKDATYEVIYRIMELLDGYQNESLKFEIINTKTGTIINESIEMHDLCENFLDCSNV